jgi:hypothetical protein
MKRVFFGQTPQTPKTWKIDSWSSMNQEKRMKFLRSVSSSAGQNPEIATLCVSIFRNKGVKPRDYKGQAQALLKWVQENIYYVNEPNERLQDPMYTLRVGYGDCDDMSLLLGAMCESVKLEYRYVLAGKCKGKIDRWIEGEPLKKGVWSHIYLIIGYPPFKPSKWVYAEPTVASAKLGWDIVQAKNGTQSMLPELAGTDMSLDEGQERSLVSQIRKGLHPKTLIPTILISAITTVLVGEVAMYFRARLKEIRKRNT